MPTISDQVSCSVECQKTTNCRASTLFRNILDLSQVCWDHKGVVEDAISLVTDESAVLEIFPQAPKYFVSLAGFRYDTSAEQSQRYKIENFVSSAQIWSLCAKFCRKEIDCKGFEVSMSTVYVHNCVLYSTLVESNLETHFESSLVAPSAYDLPIDQSETFDIFVPPDNLLSDFNLQKDCDSVYYCTENCNFDPVCVASVFGPYAGRMQCFHKIHSTNISISSSKRYSPYSEKPMTVSTFPEKFLYKEFELTGLELSDPIVTVSAFSDVPCLDLCAADGRCYVASWVGKGSFSCHFHNETTFQTSVQYFNPDAVVLFPTIADRMKATQVAV